jgi:hypothetical protein
LASFLAADVVLPNMGDMMVDESKLTTGGCMCGALRYEAAGEPITVGHCHCHSCRRHTGAPVVTVVMFDRDRVKFTKGDRKIYNSSPGVGRGFCDQCGSSLTWEGQAEGRSVFTIHISTLDNPDDFVPQRHWYHGERIAWFETADDLPR